MQTEQMFGHMIFFAAQHYRKIKKKMFIHVHDQNAFRISSTGKYLKVGYNKRENPLYQCTLIIFINSSQPFV